LSMAGDFALATFNINEDPPQNASFGCTGGQVYPATNITNATVTDEDVVAGSAAASLLPIEFVVVLVLAAACVLVGVSLPAAFSAS